eukprot:scaffold5240_cov116-Isochrysis_galbana.AAC.5
MTIRDPSLCLSDSGGGGARDDSSSTSCRVFASSCIATTSDLSENPALYATMACRASERTSAEASATICTSVSSSSSASGESTCFGQNWIAYAKQTQHECLTEGCFDSLSEVASNLSMP